MEIKKRIGLKEICDSIREKFEIIGSFDTYITTPSQIENSKKESVSFCSKTTNVAYQMIKESGAGIILCSNKLDFSGKDFGDKALILVGNPRLSFIRIMQKYFVKKQEYNEICKIGKNVIIHPNVLLGGDGFGYERDEHDELIKFPSIGGIIIEDDVEIFPFTNIDRGTLDNTIIGKGTKIDHYCHIGHNVRIGKRCVITAGVIIAGSVTVGDDVFIGINSSIRDGIKIGKHAMVGMGSVVTKDVGDNWTVYGVPAKQVQNKIKTQSNRRKSL